MGSVVSKIDFILGVETYSHNTKIEEAQYFIREFLDSSVCDGVDLHKSLIRKEPKKIAIAVLCKFHGILKDALDYLKKAIKHSKYLLDADMPAFDEQQISAMERAHKLMPSLAQNKNINL